MAQPSGDDGGLDLCGERVTAHWRAPSHVRSTVWPCQLMAEVATPLRKEESTAEEIFRKLKDNEDKRKQQFWYRVYTFTFDPNGKTRRAWDLGLMALVLYSGFMAPYRAVFTRAPRAKIIYMDTEEWFIDGLFYFDIVLNFFTGYDNGYQVVTARKEIAKRYVWFNGRNSGFFWVRSRARSPWIHCCEPRQAQRERPGCWALMGAG